MHDKKLPYKSSGNKKFQMVFRLLVVSMALFSVSLLQAQGFDPCGPGGPGCSSGPPVEVMTKMCNDSIKFGPPFDFMVGAADANKKIDTTYNGSASISISSGPGTLSGTTTVNFKRGIAVFPGLNVTVQGTYTFTVSSGALKALNCIKIIDPKAGTMPCAGAGPTTAIRFFKVPANTIANASFPAEIAAFNTNNCVDTTATASVTVSKSSGPGTISGTLSGSFKKGMLTLMVQISQPGAYRLLASSGGWKDSSMVIQVGGGTFCKEAGPVVKIKFLPVQGNAQVNAPFTVNVTALNAKECIDTTHMGSITLAKKNGPGAVSGSLTGTFMKGMASFNIKVDKPGSYVLNAASGSFTDSSAMINVGSGGPGCPPTKPSGKRANLGLYGGSSIDLTFSNSNKRLFAAISNPLSLFASDDTAKTWYSSFPLDSLEYGCGRGWGGRAVRVLSNNVGWVAVQTSQEAGTLNALVISYSNGDTGTWKTAMDGSLLQKLGLGGNGNPGNVSGMGLSDHYLYCLMGKYVIRTNKTGPINPLTDVIDVTKTISGIGSNPVVKSIAVANTSSGYPFYIVIDTSGHHSGNGLVYKYSSAATVTALPLPAGLKGAGSIFTHPGQAKADTLFVCGQSASGPAIKSFRSLDGGGTWTDITYGSGGMVGSMISDVDYSPAWVSAMSASNGMVLIMPGTALSKDMGTSWIPIGLQNNGGAIHPADTSIVLGTRGRGVVVSTKGTTGPYTVAKNYGLQAVTIKKIARTASRGTFYLATIAGLAYTTAYNNNAVAGYDKWNAPYGQFPVPNVGDDAGVFSVAIDPADSLHVIAGYSNGFALSKTGVGGFSNVMPAGYNNTDDPRVNDILFVSSTVVLAVTGGENSSHKDKGNLWRSSDGGTTWTKVSPAGFNNGNTLAMGSKGGKTVVYAGTGLSGQNTGVLWKSTDLGLTWTKVNDGPASVTNPGITKMPIYDLAVDPRSTDTLYIASGSNLDYAFAKSTDGGASYKYIKAKGEGAFTAVAVNQAYPDTVYTAIRRDIFAYDATHDSISYLYRGMPGELVPDLAIGSVLAGTSMGFYKITGKAQIITGQHKTATVNMDVNAYPNPFREVVNIRFSLAKGSNVFIRLCDITGREVKTMSCNRLDKGIQEIQLDGSGLPAGNYFLRLFSDDKVLTRQLVRVE